MQLEISEEVYELARAICKAQFIINAELTGRSGNDVEERADKWAEIRWISYQNIAEQARCMMLDRDWDIGRSIFD